MTHGVGIAIVGMGCRFPGSVRDPQGLWEFLLRKGDGIIDVPADRWSIERFYDPDPDAPGRMYVKRGGFLTDSLWDFDAEFFGISAREASIMDPQQRLLLEVAVEALDDAGMSGRVSGRSVGVYVGGFMADNQVGRHMTTVRTLIDSHVPTSGTHTMLSNRLSYVLNLLGPSLTIDTACSSSLVAFHEAVRALAAGECELAVAGGTNALLRPETFVSMCKGRFLAPDGRCKTFDAAADGYARGEGAGAVILKPLDAALADGDRIYAVVVGTAVNQDGRTSGITVPNRHAQEALARQVLAQAGMSGAEVGFVEAHGTGTALGDPLEVAALGAAFGTAPGREQPVWVGSIKASIGHTEAAAGIASVIKAALVLHHRTIPPQAYLERLNPEIPFDELNVRVPTEAHPLPESPGGGFYAAANGFGYGGTNAHAILTAAPQVAAQRGGDREKIQLLPVSGSGADAVRELAGRLADSVQNTDELELLVDASWSRRAHHSTRAAISYSTPEELVEALRDLADGRGQAPLRTLTGVEPRPVFVFSGMGPQWWGMGRDLLEAGGTFTRVAESIDARFREIAGFSILDEMRRDEESSRLSSTEFAQPANFVLQVALTAHLKDLGIEPVAVLGHSVGEVSAAYVSGALSLDDALLVSYHRARLQATTSGSGSMLAVGLSEEEAIKWLSADSEIDVAAVNSPSAVTLAGPTEALTELSERLSGEGIFARMLRVEVPYHSRLMDPILEQVADALSPLTPSVPVVPLVSSVTAEPVTDAGWGASYWVDNVRQPVRFAAAMLGLIEAGHRVFLEVGPHPVLSGNIREILLRSDTQGASVPTLTRKQNDLRSISEAVGGLYKVGCLPTGGRPGQGPEPTPHVELPRYPWQRRELWTEAPVMVSQRLGDPDLPAMLATRIDSAAPEWETELSVGSLPWLPDHVVDGLELLPGAAYLDAALSAAAQLVEDGPYLLQDVRFVAPLVIDAGDVPTLRIAVEPASGRFTLRGRPANGSTWTVHATGRVQRARATPAAIELPADGDSQLVSGEDLYRQLDQIGLQYGPSFRRVQSLARAGDTVVAMIDNPFTDSRHLAHPAVVDAALQCVAALAAIGPDAAPVVPAAIGAVRRYGELPASCTTVIRRHRSEALIADIAMLGEDGQVVLELLDVELRPIRQPAGDLARFHELWGELKWEERPAPYAESRMPADPGIRTVLCAVGHEPSALGIELASLLGQELIPVPGRLSEPKHEALAGAVRDALSHDVTVVRVVVVAGPNDVSDSECEAGLAQVARTLRAAAPEAGMSALDTRMIATVITTQALTTPGEIDPPNMGHAGLLGGRRALRNEQSDIDWRLVDVASGTTAAALAEELDTGAIQAEEPITIDEVALRGGRRLVLVWKEALPQRLESFERPEPLGDPDRGFRVRKPHSSLLADLALRAEPRRAPGPWEIEVRVDAAGLNYKDPLKVTGVLGKAQLEGTYFGIDLGMECHGEVVAVGAEVSGFAVGQKVMMGAANSLVRYLTFDPREVIVDHAPVGWSRFGCASLVPYLTAHYALAETARPAPGETVLIHGAAGGVGMAAVKVAKALGAKVIGTASTPARRELVLAAGADHVLDSRTIDFVTEVRRLTDGRGADVILNSAPGEALAASLEAAAEQGRIVEIGKAGIYGGASIGLAAFDRNLSLIAVDIDRLLEHNMARMKSVVEGVLEAFESGVYPELPTTVYGVDQLTEAFQATLASTHVGRVALDFNTSEVEVLPELPRPPIRADARYLITGGFGSFGLASAQWLVEAGARHLVLVGRRGATSDDARAKVQSLVEAGAEVEEALVDISDADAVRGLIDSFQAGPPLRGIFHAAGVLDDQPITALSRESLETVRAPKVMGALNLHRATMAAGVELDAFVLYSSVTALTGNPSQYAYGAANATLDSLAAHRRGQGLPATSVNWGALAGGGMAEAADDVMHYLDLIGVGLVDMGLATRGLGQILELNPIQVSFAAIDWLKWAAAYPSTARTPRLAEQIEEARSGAAGAQGIIAELLALPEDERREVLVYMLAEQLATVLGIPAEAIDLSTPLPDLGLDSLMAVELGTRVNMSIGLEIPALELTRGLSLRELGAKISPNLVGGSGDPDTAGEPESALEGVQ